MGNNDAAGLWLGEATGFTTTKERLGGKGSMIPFRNEEVAKEPGAIFLKKRAFSPHALQDGRIITGQNPESFRVETRPLLENLEQAAR